MPVQTVNMDVVHDLSRFADTIAHNGCNQDLPHGKEHRSKLKPLTGQLSHRSHIAELYGPVSASVNLAQKFGDS